MNSRTKIKTQEPTGSQDMEMVIEKQETDVNLEWTTLNYKQNGHPYDETIAQDLYKSGQIDKLTEYCLPTINGYLHKHKWLFLNPNTYDDVYQELSISIVNSIMSYKPSAGVKLFSWIYTNFRFTCMAIQKKECPYQTLNIQLDDIDSEATYYHPDYSELDQDQKPQEEKKIFRDKKSIVKNQPRKRRMKTTEVSKKSSKKKLS